jgi:hypothetical protein
MTYPIRSQWCAVALLTATACLSEPELRECYEFEIGSQESCGDNPCEIYCQAMVEVCPGVFPSMGACMADCADEPDDPTIVQGAFGDEEGNSIACRLTQLSESGSAGCPEARLIGTTACVNDPCEEYCELMLTSCEGAFPISSNQDGVPQSINCTNTCAMYPRAGNDGDANSLECRLRYARLASQSGSEADCNAAAPHGANVCGDPCDTYCNFTERNCRETVIGGEVVDNRVYPDRPSCEAVCNLMDKEGDYRDWTINPVVEADTVACRIYHAGPPAMGDPIQHCPHARVYNPEHCGVDPTNVLPDWPCEAYCNSVTANCPGVYADLAECQAECPQLPEVMGLGASVIVDLFPESTQACPTR